MASFVPEIFGKYLLMDQIAAGGMAELYRAKVIGVEGFEKLIAIKKILFHLHDDAELVDSFIAEAKLAAFLHHQNIVQVYDFGCVDDNYFLAMEYLSGKDLRFLIKKIKECKKKIPVSIAIYIVMGICAGMHYAHKLKDYSGKPLNIIHRDIGPQNIFITYSGEVKIIDFGIAKAATHETNTQLGIIKGKVAYMSPEQARGEKIDSVSDIFSIGVILYELLTGKKMYEGETFRIYNAACNADYTKPSEITDKLPPELYSVLGKSLAKDRDKRYQTAHEMLVDLDKCIQARSMNISPHMLSKYMSAVFSKELIEEKIAIREATYTSPKAVGETPEKPHSDVSEETYENNGGDFTKKTTSIKNYSGYLSLLMLMVFFIYIFFNIETYRNIPWINKGYIIVSKIVHKDKSEDVLKKGNDLMHQLLFAEAADYFKANYEGDIAYREKIKPHYIKALNEAAVSLLDTKPEHSASLLYKIIDIDPDNTKALFLLGKYHNSRKEYDKALENYRKAIVIDDKNPEILFNMGYIYAIKKDNLRAEEMFSAVVSLEPPFVDEALVNLAIIQSKSGNTGVALENINKALKINPANKQANKIRQTLIK